MEVKFISKKFIDKYFEIGRNSRNLSALEIEEIVYKEDIWKNWEAGVMFELGLKYDTYEIKEYYRYGDLNLDEYNYPRPSWNGIEEKFENGVSVADEQWENTISGVFIISHYNCKKISLKGIEVGVGGDGEKLILPVGF